MTPVTVTSAAEPTTGEVAVALRTMQPGCNIGVPPLQRGHHSCMSDHRRIRRHEHNSSRQHAPGGHPEGDEPQELTLTIEATVAPEVLERFNEGIRVGVISLGVDPDDIED